MPDEVHPVIEAAQKYKAQLERQEVQALGRLIDAYGRAYNRLLDKIDLLIAQIGDKEPTKGQVTRLTRYKELITQVAAELQGLQSLTANEIEKAGQFGIEVGNGHAVNLISYSITGDPSLSGSLNRLPKETIQTLLGFLSPDGALYERLGLMAPTVTQLVSDAIVDGVGLGYNPRKIAAEIRRNFGIALTDALRMTRTVQLWSYREANRATYIANNDVVNGWYWLAALDDRTCMSCINQHGKFYPLDKTLNDHHNGRCTSVPAVRGLDNPIEQSGEEWFKGQGEAVQRKMMGKGKYEAWKAGKFEFGQLTAINRDGVYGPMRVEQTLKGLTGGKPPKAPEQTSESKFSEVPQFAATKEAEEWALNNLISKSEIEYARRIEERGGKPIKLISYRGLSPEVANRINKQLQNLYDEGLPPLKRILTTSGKGKKWIAQYSTAGELRLNTTEMGTVERVKSIQSLSDFSFSDEARKALLSLQSRRATLTSLELNKLNILEEHFKYNRFYVDDTLEGLINHELGHHFDNAVGRVNLGKATELRNKFNNDRDAAIKEQSLPEYKYKLSEYPFTIRFQGSYEIIAESFVAYIRGEYASLSPKMLQLFEEYFR